MKKKILSLVLAATMVMGMSITAFAAETTDITAAGADGAYSTELTGELDVELPVIKVTVPSSLSDIVLNPYCIEVTYEGAANSDSVITAAQTITSESNVPLSVDVTATAAVEKTSGVKFATARLKGTETTKSVFAYVTVGATEADLVTLENWEKGSNVVIFKSGSATQEGMGRLAVGTTTPSSLTFKVVGEAAASASPAWSEADTFAAKVKFTFNPVLPSEGEERGKSVSGGDAG